MNELISARARRAAKAGAGALLLALLAGCATVPVEVATEPEAVEERPGWLNVLSADDALRLEQLEGAFGQALAEARRRGFARHLAREGPLLDPGAGLPRAILPPGPYRCRTLRFGGQARGRPYLPFASAFCHVVHEGELLSLTRGSGRERPGGYLWEDGPDRMIFIGATALSGEALPPAYGDRPERDLVGLLERVGTFRYRLVLLPSAPGRVDVIELIPAVSAD